MKAVREYTDKPVYKVHKEIKETKYYKEIITPFVQPILTSNGTLGGDSFAVASNNFPWNNTALHYMWFDGQTGQNGNGTSHRGGGYSIIYNPIPIKITSVIADAGYSGDWFDVVFYGSDDGQNWEQICYIGHGLRTKCDVNSPKFYNYYKIYNQSGFGHDGHGYGGGVAELHITATQREIIETTKDDYDYYIDIPVYHAINI